MIVHLCSLRSERLRIRFPPKFTPHLDNPHRFWTLFPPSCQSYRSQENSCTTPRQVRMNFLWNFSKIYRNLQRTDQFRPPKTCRKVSRRKQDENRDFHNAKEDGSYREQGIWWFSVLVAERFQRAEIKTRVQFLPTIFFFNYLKSFFRQHTSLQWYTKNEPGFDIYHRHFFAQFGCYHGIKRGYLRYNFDRCKVHKILSKNKSTSRAHLTSRMSKRQRTDTKDQDEEDPYRQCLDMLDEGLIMLDISVEQGCPRVFYANKALLDTFSLTIECLRQMTFGNESDMGLVIFIWIKATVSAFVYRIKSSWSSTSNLLILAST